MPVAVRSSPSRRFSSRVPTLPIPIGEVWVYWECGNRRDISRVRDISMHGLFIETRKPVIKGASTSLHFLVQDGQIRADAVVRHAMKQQHPREVGIRRRDPPAAQQHTVRRAHVERLAVRVGDREGSIGFANQVGRKLAPDGVQIRGRDQPPGHRRQHRRQEQQKQHHANDSSTHGCVQQGIPSSRTYARSGPRVLAGMPVSVFDVPFIDGSKSERLRRYQEVQTRQGPLTKRLVRSKPTAAMTLA
ncbi:MAG: PilZ domain-containing protein [Acidobacteria bacterium Pan2503]|uniref:PilZ domain-containing protein n=1 Tax=Candidatus Acidiferrum panamense TaxID=2741543 RepID=A0A7V8NUM1_9BACT|nr:PilZ domain-containing protein [Candidatus Acidoferrum panamensis]